jgi:nucleoside-diphosphate-sugar epimerase
MKVLVTGGTGFVGSHTVAAVAASGHEVRLLVRAPERVRPALDPLGVGEVEVVTGDVTDLESVQAAVKGCDAVIHAASVYSFDRRRDGEIRRTNVKGTELVLGTAVEAGLDPVVHVSSSGALLSKQRATMTPDSPPGDAPGTYWRSKAESERVARRFQERGAPVVITYPSAVLGPHDPHVGDSTQVVIAALEGALRFASRLTIVISDVRDVAALHCAVLERQRGPRRYLATGIVLMLGDLLTRLAALTGHRLPTSHLPGALLLTLARVMDGLQRVAPFRMPMDMQPIYAGIHTAGWDDSRTRHEFGLAPQDLDKTLGDTVRWLYQQGHISAQLAGRVARNLPPS